MSSRMQVARYVADAISEGRRTEAVNHAAAWLISNGRKHEASYLTKDVATVLLDRGYATITATVARPLTAASRQNLVSFAQRVTEAKHIELREIVDEQVVGGVRLTTPTAELDETVQHRLQTFAKGVN